LRDPDLYADAMSQPGRVETVHDIEARLGARRPVAGRHVGAEIEFRVRRIAQVASDRGDMCHRDDDCPVTDEIADLRDAARNRGLQRRNKSWWLDARQGRG